MYAKVVKKPKQTDQLQTNNDNVEGKYDKTHFLFILVKAGFSILSFLASSHGFNETC